MIKVESLKHQTIQSKEYKLTPIFNRNELFQRAMTTTDDISISIQPGQHLFIPIEFGFDTRGIKKSSKYASELDRGKAIEAFKKPIFFHKPFFEGESLLTRKSRDELAQTLFFPVQLTPQFIADTPSRTELNAKIPDRFAVGTLMNIVSVTIDGKEIETDTPLNDPRFSMSVYFAYGSCPYLIVYDSDKGYWKELGTVLTDRRDSSLQGTELYSLGDRSTKIRIEERDQELTYIDSLAIVYIDPVTQQEKEVNPNIESLKFKDGNYFTLQQSESLELDIQKLVPRRAANLKLKINGYYKILDPDKLMKSNSLQESTSPF